MYTKRAQLVNFSSLRNLFQVCQIRTPNLFRNLSIATERSDFYTNIDDKVSETQLGHSIFNQNGVFQSTNFEPSRVYGQRLNDNNGVFNGESSDNYNALGGIRSSGNRLDYNYGNGNSQFSNNSNLGYFEKKQKSSGFNGQSGSFIGSNNGNKQQEPRGQFFAGPTDFRGTHEERMYQQTDNNGVYYSNEGTYNGESVGVVQGNQVERRIEDLDELIKEGKVKEAVEFIKLLNPDGLHVDVSRYIALMELCGENEALEEAKTVHDYVLNSTPNVDTSTSNKILDMYCKCGSMVDAFAVFDKMPQWNLTSWDTMITGLAKNGLGENSMELFEEFKKSGLKPDAQIFIGVFSACGVLCDSTEGMLQFESMIKDYGIEPSMEHYVGMVDMFGTAGCLDEALEFIENMPFESNVDIWETLMKFCRIHGNVELGDRCAEQVQLLDSSRLNDQSRQGLIPIDPSDIEKEKAKQKLSGQNLLDVRNRVHEYRAGDKSHPDHEKIYALLRGLKQQMKEEGYVPETKFVLHDVDDESKEEALMAHSERLAAAKGFMTSAARSDLRIIKNLRVCGDCHKAFKIISKIVGRAIIARDTKRFHRFANGSCSCNDFW